jgi:hypothetical protein
MEKFSHCVSIEDLVGFKSNNPPQSLGSTFETKEQLSFLIYNLSHYIFYRYFIKIIMWNNHQKYHSTNHLKLLSEFFINSLKRNNEKQPFDFIECVAY